MAVCASIAKESLRSKEQKKSVWKNVLVSDHSHNLRTHERLCDRCEISLGVLDGRERCGWIWVDAGVVRNGCRRVGCGVDAGVEYGCDGMRDGGNVGMVDVVRDSGCGVLDAVY